MPYALSALSDGKGNHGRRGAGRHLRRHDLALTQARINQRTQMRAVVEKLQTRPRAISAATTEAEVEAVIW